MREPFSFWVRPNRIDVLADEQSVHRPGSIPGGIKLLPSVRPIVICTGSGIPVVFAVAWMLGF
jgi:hypothetical protein